MTLDEIRRTLALALGLGVACGPKVQSGEDGGDASTHDASTDPSGASTEVPPDETSTSTTPTGDDSSTEVLAWPGCTDPEPILQPDGITPSGFERCADGRIVRVSAEQCLSLAGECTVDADCPSDFVCVCTPLMEVQPFCVPARCRDGSDCGDELCGFMPDLNPCFGAHLACFTSDDRCRTDDDCEATSRSCGPPESYEPAGPWTCKFTGCDKGRPFLVDGHARTAREVVREDWLTHESPRLDDLSPALRRELAARWATHAAFEHASVASFGRFILQLMAVGAPARLVESATRAMRDEVEHARRAYGLASAYGGTPVGPGRLDVSGPIAGDLEAVILAVIEEGCIGETLAAVEAAVASTQATDPCVRACLQKIAADELRHAALAWQTLAWALDGRFVAVLAQAIAEHRARLASEPPRALPGEIERQLAAHGLASDEARRNLHLRALASVVTPLAQALSRRVHEAPAEMLHAPDLAVT